jgi:hypothetical protein
MVKVVQELSTAAAATLIYPCAKIVIKPISLRFGKKETN